MCRSHCRKDLESLILLRQSTEPIDYVQSLCKAVDILEGWDIPVAIFNIPLCLLPKEFHHFATRSISDWKTKYLDTCDSCLVKKNCCGLFGTSRRTYMGLKPLC